MTVRYVRYNRHNRATGSYLDCASGIDDNSNSSAEGVPFVRPAVSRYLLHQKECEMSRSLLFFLGVMFGLVFVCAHSASAQITTSETSEIGGSTRPSIPVVESAAQTGIPVA